LTIGQGQTVALVGPSGCGKSTIVGLLQRFYDPTNGRVLINNVDVQSLDIKAHRYVRFWGEIKRLSIQPTNHARY
jgi:ABC-type multidrug transport system fused ATPase/permease subunit